MNRLSRKKHRADSGNYPFLWENSENAITRILPLLAQVPLRPITRTRANLGDVISSFRSRGEYISGSCVLSRRISPPFPHMQHRYWQQPLIIPGTPTAIHNCHSHYNLHLGHCETVACVSTALLRRLSLIQLYSVDVPSYHYTARASASALPEQEGARNRQFRMSERAREIDTGNFVNLRLEY